MAQTLETAATARGTFSFEVERFELVDGDRLELSGRWFGVRGRRFIRPTITLQGEEGETRLLAELYHKPWSAEDGERWEAWFPFEPGGTVTDTVELAVAPDIMIDLLAPAAVRGRPSAAAPPRRSRSLTRRNPVREELERLRGEVRQLRDGRVQLESGRGDAVRERDAAIAERDAAIAERSRVARMLEREREQRSAIVDSLERARTERASLEQAFERAVSDRDAALSARDAALSERDAALSDRDAALSERDAALSQQDAGTTTARHVAASIEPVPVTASRAIAPTPSAPNLVVRMLAIGVLIAAAIAVLIVLQSA